MSRFRDQLFAGARRDSTKRTYSTGLNAFYKFCQFYQFRNPTVLEPDYVADVVSLFIASLALRGLAFGTIHNYLFAVRSWAMDASLGTVNPVDSYLVKQVLTGIKQLVGHRPKPKFAILPEFLVAIFVLMGTSALDKRDWALFVIAFWALLRKAELLALKWGNVKAIPGGMSLFIADSKTDKDRKGMEVVLAARNDILCPVRAIMALASVVPEAQRGLDSPIAVASNKSAWTAKALASKSFVGRIKYWVERIGLDPANYSGHSFRRGGATTMARAGIPPEIIQIQRRWRSDAYKLYVQLGLETLLKATSVPID